MPLGLLLNADGNERQISIKNAIIMCIIAVEIYAIYKRFEDVEQEHAQQVKIHAKDIEHLKDQMAYERERIDRKFQRLEQ